MTTILERLDELKRIADAATPGPWRLAGNPSECFVKSEDYYIVDWKFADNPRDLTIKNGELIATSRTAFPQLVEACIALIKQRDALLGEVVTLRGIDDQEFDPVGNREEYREEKEELDTPIAALLEVTG